DPMSAYKSEFLRVLAARGFIHQISEPEALDRLAQSSTVTGYIGFDCTAPSLHVGNLVSIMMLYWMQQTGHRPIALMGGGTTRVGDPSGKDESRKLLDEAMIARNLAGIRAVFDKFLDFVELYRRQRCVLQMGGSDQWGNIVNGIDLGRRMLNAQLFALTSPLITTSSGAKMGKTAVGAVWLNPDMVSPYDYWQFWRNTE